MSLPDKIRSLRAAAEITVAMLALRAKVSRQMIHAIEQGKRQPSLEVARKRCHALGCSLAEFDRD